MSLLEQHLAAVPIFRRTAALIVLASVILFARPVGQAQGSSALPFAKGYLVAGDYVVGSGNLTGSSTGGFRTGTISITGVPANADILAAFLYWQTFSSNI